MNKNSIYGNSSFWFDSKWDVEDDFDILTGEDIEKKPGKDLIKLAAYQRAISNFVNIVTGDIIPVTFKNNNDGSSHTDGANHYEYTVMVMNNTKWKPEWGGQFQMLDEHGTILEEHDYIPVRVVVFPGWIRHRGLAPLVPYVYRFTTVFRVIMEQEKVSLIHEKL